MGRRSDRMRSQKWVADLRLSVIHEAEGNQVEGHLLRPAMRGFSHLYPIRIGGINSCTNAQGVRHHQPKD
jgi:hypothetical protein